MGPRGTEIDDSTPEDVAALYSWAKLTGAKYRDYSAERRARRAQMRYRAAKEQLQSELDARSGKGAETAEAADSRSYSAHQGEAAANAALRAIEEEREIAEARESARRKQEMFEQAEKLLRERTGPQPGAGGATAQSPAVIRAVEEVETRTSAATAGVKDETPAGKAKAAATPVPTSATAVTPIRPAWLEEVAEGPWPDEAAANGPPAIAVDSGRTSAAAATLLDSREQVALRWPALQLLIEQMKAQVGTARVSWSRGPVIAIISPRGGAGKTSLTAALARGLARSGERVLVVEGAPPTLLSLQLGMEQSQGSEVRAAPPREGDRGTVSLTRFIAGPPERERQEVTEALLAKAQGCDRILLDVGPDAAWLTQRLGALRPMALAAITPDMNSISGIQAIEESFAAITDSDGRALLPFYLLNQFDARLPLHLDIREVLGRQLGRRLTNVTVRRSPAIGEALAEGRTVLEYAPDSPAARDLSELASWLQAVAPASAEAITAAGGARGGR